MHCRKHRVSLLICLSVPLSLLSLASGSLRGAEPAAAPAAATADKPAETPPASTPAPIAQPVPTPAAPAATAPATEPAATASAGAGETASKASAVEKKLETPSHIGFARLADEGVAAFLELTDEQKAQVTAALQERVTLLKAAGSVAERLRAHQDSEDKLAAILTEAQRIKFTEQFLAPRLKFSFRFQRWIDVLEWFAQQSDLSLVLDAPPPGTFNYSDSREYTPREAMDLLNGVLAIKGYTLVRHGRMLMVLDLHREIPDGIIPRVELDDLENRGQFELVSVMFPLEGRDAAKVYEEIQPLFGPNGDAIPLPQTKQMLVTDAAGNMKVIGATIQSIPVPTPPPKPPTPPKPEVSKLEVYQVKSVAPQTVVDTIRLLFPDMKIVVDPKTDQINAFAVPSQQAVLKSMIDQMEAPDSPDARPQIAFYPLDERNFKNRDIKLLDSTLELIAPKARIRVDYDMLQVVAWATPKDQQLLREALHQLGHGSVGEETRQLEVYSLKKANPDSTLETLQELLPHARLTVDSLTHSLIAVAVPSEQLAIKAMVEQMETAPAADTTLQFYPFERDLPDDIASLFEKLVPNAQVSVDTENKRVVALAAAADQALIKKTLEEAEKNLPPEDEYQLVIYPVTPAQRTRFEAVLGTVTTGTSARAASASTRSSKSSRQLTASTPEMSKLTGVTVVTDAQPGELAIWATASQHEIIAQIIEELKRDVPDEQKFQLEAYPLVDANSSTTLSVLEDLYPDTKVVQDAANHRLLIWADAKTHEAIKKTLDKLQGETAGDFRPRFESYPIRGVDSAELIKNLQALVPSVRVTVNTEKTKLIVWGTPREHDQIKNALQALNQGDTLESTRQLEVHRLGKLNPTTTLQLLQGLLPNAQLTLDATTNSLIAVAIPDDQKAIAAMLEQLEPDRNGPDSPQLRFYPLTNEVPDNLTTVLGKLVPDAQITVDQDADRMTVVATEADHEVIRTTLDQLAKNLPANEKRRLGIYPVTPAQRKRFEAIQNDLMSEYPGMTVITDAEPGELAIWAKPTQHLAIAEVINELRRDVPDEEKLELVAYPLRSADPETAQSVLESMFPGVKIVIDEDTDRLLIWTRPSDHERIKQTIEQLDSSDHTDARTEGFRVYPFREADPVITMQLLQEQLPKVKFVQDTTAKSVIAWVKRESDDALITKIIESLQANADERYKPTMVAYSAGTADATALVEFLKTIVPNANLTVDTKNNSLMAWASPDDQETIRTSVEQMVQQASGQGGTRVVVYNMENAGAAAAYTILRSAFPNMQFNYTSKAPDKLIAWGSGADHELVAQIVQSLEDQSSKFAGLELKIHEVSGIAGTDAQNLFRAVLPKAIVAPSRDPNRIVVWAKPEEQALISQFVKQIAEEHARESKRTMHIYSLHKADATSALELLKELLPGVKFLSDRRGKTITAWAEEAEHKQIAETLDKLEAGPDAKYKPKLVIYPIGKADAASVSQFLATAVPEAQVTVDAASGNLMVMATPDDHATVRETIDEIVKNADGATAAKVVVYDLENSSAVAAYTMLRRAFPKMTFNYTSATKLVAWGSDADHQMVAKIVDALENEETKRAGLELRIYDVDGISATDARTLLTTIVPKVTFTPSTEPNRLIVWAKTQDHALIEKVLTQVAQEKGKDTDRVMQIHSVGKANITIALPMLQELLPSVKFISDPTAGTLIAWAKEAEHELITQTLDKLASGPDEKHKPFFQSYPVGKADPTQMSQFLMSVAPSARITVDTASNSLSVWATQDDQDTIKKTVEQMVKQAEGAEAPSVIVHDMPSGNALSAYYLLHSAFPRMQISYNTDRTKLITWGPAADQAIVKQIIEQMESGAAVRDGYTLKVYTVTDLTAAEALDILKTAVPRVKFTTNAADPYRLIALGMPEDHALIQQILSELSAGGEGTTDRSMKVYTIHKADPLVALQALQEKLPHVKFLTSRRSDTLIAWVTEKDDKEITAILEQLESGPDAQHKPVLMLYPIGQADSTTLTTLLTKVVPDATVTVDAKSGSLAIMATPEDHKDVKATIDLMVEQSQGEGATKAVVYDLPTTGGAAAYTILRVLFPRMRFMYTSADRAKLLALGSAADQELVAKTIEEFEDQSKKREGLEIKTYDVKPLGATKAQQLLAKVVPTVTFTTGTDTNTLIAWAKPEDHALIEKTLAELPDMPEKVSKVYRMQKASTQAVYTVLRSLVPNATIAYDFAGHTLTINALPDDHKTIQETIDQMESIDEEHTPTLTIYPVDNLNPTTVSTFLRSVAPNARVTVDTTTGNLMAWATPADHLVIKATIDQMIAQAGDSAAEVVMYDLENTGALAAYYILTSAFPRMQFQYSRNDRTKLIAFGPPADHVKVKALVEQLEAAASMKEGLELKTYNVEAVGATRAISMLKDVVPKAKLVTGPNKDQLVVWAKPEDHVVIENIISQMPEVEKEISHVYRLQKADPRAVYTILKSLVPDARVMYDLINHSIMASALPKDHEIIQSAIDDMETLDPEHTPTLVVYPIESEDTDTVVDFLQTVAPNAKLTMDENTGKLLAWATSEDHTAIKSTLDEINKQAGEGGSQVVIYNVEGTGAVGAYYVLRRAFPNMTFSYSPRNDARLMAFGTAADHKKAKQLIDQLEMQNSQRTGFEMRIYDVDGYGARQAENLLEDIVREANYVRGDDPDELIVWAKPEDHETIQKILDDLPKPPDTTTRIYYFRKAEPEAVADVLASLVPEAEMSVDDENHSIIVTATAEDHEKLAKTVEEMDQENPNDPRPRVEIHPIGTANSQNIYSVVRALYRYKRDVQLSYDEANNALIAVAPPDEQEEIRQLIADVEKAGGPLGTNMTLKVYDVSIVGAKPAFRLLDDIVPDVNFTLLEDPNKISAWAKPEQHAVIEKVLAGMPPMPEMVSQVYYLRKANPDAVLSVLEKLTPDAELVVDEENSSIVASAVEEDHEKIKKAIAEIEAERPDEQTPRVEIHPITTAEPLSVYTMLKFLFRNSKDVQLSVDRRNNAVVAFARPDDHDKIRELIKSVEEAGAAGSGEVMNFYSVKDMDSTMVEDLLKKLVEEKGGRIDISMAPSTEQMIVVARPEIHELVEETLDGLKVEERTLEVYQLEIVDPLTAQIAASTLYGEDNLALPPIIDSDATTQRLFVRATKEQHEQIRDLLVKMGEETLRLASGISASNSRLRKIPFEGDTYKALEQIQRVWPKLRSNPIQVIKPPSLFERNKTEPTDEKSNEKESTTDNEQSRADAFDFESALAAVGQSDVDLEVVAPAEASHGIKAVDKEKTAHQASKAIKDTVPAARDKAPPEKPQDGTTPSDNASGSDTKKPAATETSAPSDGEPTEATDPNAPILVIPSYDGITISCDDPAALDQFESLLRALSTRSDTIGRNLTVITLQNVAAATVAQTLNGLYRSSRTMSSIATGPVTIVPDERLNAVIVHANRVDRMNIRALVDVLDTAEIPDSLAIRRPKLIPVKNTDAARIRAVLATLYKTHMSTRGTGSPLPIPRGIPSQLAGALQEINAATAGPLLTIDVEEKSNSLVVMAPSNLMEEIEALVAELDQASLDDRSRRVTLIQLKKTNSRRIQQALDMLTRGGSSRSRSSSSRSRGSSLRSR